MTEPNKKPITERMRRIRRETCERLTADGLRADPIPGAMSGELVKSNNFAWMIFDIADKIPTVDEINQAVRRHNLSFVAVLQPTEHPFAVVPWDTFTELMRLAKDREEAKLREDREKCEAKYAKLIQKVAAHDDLEPA